MIEDWTIESLEQYQVTEGAVAIRNLPDDTIGDESERKYQLMGQLAGGRDILFRMSDSVLDFLSLAVRGSKVLEDDTAFCRVAWVANGEVAEPVLSLLPTM